MNKYRFKFIDLFAGIGGFHQALTYFGGKAVFASEIDQKCVRTYEKQFNLKVAGDINDNIDNIPKFDFLVAGFPCQPFSKAGKQLGFNDKKRGTLFDSIIQILSIHPECKFILLENVRNLGDKKENWDIIQSKLNKLDFFITKDPLILSPSMFGIPQNRERVYILGIRKDIRNQKKLKNGYIHIEDLDIKKHFKKLKMGDAFKVLEKNQDNLEKYYIKDDQLKIINAWSEFKKTILKQSIGAPIWVDYFGVGINDFYHNKKIGYEMMPDWKQKLVYRNHEFYKKNKKIIDPWIKKYNILQQKKIYRKFEWNCGNACNDLKEGIIQFRQSGIRVKRATTFPSLVAIVNTPIIWDSEVEKFRYITPREAANLQNFRKGFKFQGTDHDIYKQLGNSVNVRIIKLLVENLLKFSIEGWDGD